MTFEFSNKIEELASKLSLIQKNKRNDERLDEAKEQLSELQSMIFKELDGADKRMKKIENKLKKRAEIVNQ